MNEKLNNDSEAATSQHWDGCVCVHSATLASTPSPAQPTEANRANLEERAEAITKSLDGVMAGLHTIYDVAKVIPHPYNAVADQAAGMLHDFPGVARKINAYIVALADSQIVAPSPVQGADDQLAQVEAVIAQVEALAAKAEHGALRWQDPLPVPEWVERVRAIIQQSPQAALNEVRAEAWDEGQGEGTVAAINFTPLPPNPYRAHPAELRAQSGAAE